MSKSNRFFGLGAAVAAIAIAGCSGGGGDPANGTLSVSLMDGPADDVAAVHVQITALWLKPHGSGPAQELTMTADTISVDLMQLDDEATAALLLDGVTVPAGSYEWLAMDMNADFDGVYDSYVVTKAGGQEEVRVPSGRVRLVSGFEVGANEAVQVIFDWDLRTGLVDAPGQAGYFLKPAFRMIDVTEYGSLSGTVPTTTITSAECGVDTDPIDVDVGNFVYIFDGASVVPDDIDGVTPDPIATAEVKQSTSGDYAYRVILPPGNYTVAFTCQAGNDDPETDDVIAFSTPVDVVMDTAAVVVDF